MINLNSAVGENFCSGKDMVLEAISDNEYRYKRHAIIYSIAAVYTECPDILSELEKHIRETDKVIKISPMCFCVCYDVTDTSGALKASQKLINYFSKANNTSKIYIGVTSAGSDDSNYDIVTRAFYTLNEAKKHNISTALDDSVLDSLV